MAQTHKFRKGKSLFSTTLSVGISTGTGETIALSSTVGLPTDTEITLTFDRVDADGVATPVKVERITGLIIGNNLTSYTRAIDQTTEQAHSAGAVVEYIWNADDLGDIVDGILQEHDQDGVHKAAALDGMIDGTEAQGDIAYRNATVWTRLATGTAGQSLKVNSGATAPEWVTTSSLTETFTNKRTNPRLVTAASYTTDTGTSLSVATCDQFEVTALAGALKFNNPGGTPVGGNKLIIRVKDDGTARALTYDTQFRASSDLALPTTTIVNKTLYMGFIFNATDTKWDLIAYLDNF